LPLEKIPANTHRLDAERITAGANCICCAGGAHSTIPRMAGEKLSVRRDRLKSLHSFCTTPTSTYVFAHFLHTMQACTEFAQVFLLTVATKCHK
jgi:hypothetical protein